MLADPAYADGEEPNAPDDPGADDVPLRADEPVLPPAVDPAGAEPGPTDGVLIGAGKLTSGTDGVVTVGVWIGGTGTGTGGGVRDGTLIVGTI